MNFDNIGTTVIHRRRIDFDYMLSSPVIVVNRHQRKIEEKTRIFDYNIIISVYLRPAEAIRLPRRYNRSQATL